MNDFVGNILTPGVAGSNVQELTMSIGDPSGSASNTGAGSEHNVKVLRKSAGISRHLGQTRSPVNINCVPAHSI